eukprot:7391915-Prymnesium_polylepis.4
MLRLTTITRTIRQTGMPTEPQAIAASLSVKPKIEANVTTGYKPQGMMTRADWSMCVASATRDCLIRLWTTIVSRHETSTRASWMRLKMSSHSRFATRPRPMSVCMLVTRMRNPMN